MLKTSSGCLLGKSLVYIQGTSGWLPWSHTGGIACPSICLIGSSPHQFIELIAVVQSLSCVWLFVTPWATAHQVVLSIISWSLLRFISISQKCYLTISFCAPFFSSGLVWVKKKGPRHLPASGLWGCHLSPLTPSLPSSESCDLHQGPGSYSELLQLGF